MGPTRRSYGHCGTSSMQHCHHGVELITALGVVGRAGTGSGMEREGLARGWRVEGGSTT